MIVEQTKWGSLIEAVLNTLIGFWINFTANLLILPLFGFGSLTLKNNFIIGIIYTVISVIRGYAVRRWFNQYLKKAANALTNH